MVRHDACLLSTGKGTDPMRRFMTASLLAVAMLALAAAPALAQDDYPPDPGPTAAVSDIVVVPGEAITVVGDGWQPGSTVTIDLGGAVLGTAPVGQDGTFSTTVTIPANTRPGAHTLRISGTGADGQPRTVTIAITVVETAGVGTPGVTPGTGLPTTGGQPLLALFAATGLLVTGSAAVLVARRRNRASLTG